MDVEEIVVVDSIRFLGTDVGKNISVDSILFSIVGMVEGIFFILVVGKSFIIVVEVNEFIENVVGGEFIIVVGGIFIIVVGGIFKIVVGGISKIVEGASVSISLQFVSFK